MVANQSGDVMFVDSVKEKLLWLRGNLCLHTGMETFFLA